MKIRQSCVSIISRKSSLSLFQYMFRQFLWNMHIIIKTVIACMHTWVTLCCPPHLHAQLRSYGRTFELRIVAVSVAFLSRRLQHAGSGSAVCASQSLLLRCFVYNIARVNVVPSCLCVLFSSWAFIFRSAFILVTYSDKASSVPNWICICN